VQLDGRAGLDVDVAGELAPWLQHEGPAGVFDDLHLEGGRGRGDGQLLPPLAARVLDDEVGGVDLGRYWRRREQRGREEGSRDDADG
jgi:hypothetical protein